MSKKPIINIIEIGLEKYTSSSMVNTKKRLEISMKILYFMNQNVKSTLLKIVILFLNVIDTPGYKENQDMDYIQMIHNSITNLGGISTFLVFLEASSRMTITNNSFISLFVKESFNIKTFSKLKTIILNFNN
ncbi:hypothetical protein PPL_11769 [Heterostelium album PN500]|uniref:Uncharacterized protein n=1 Tax=Heterostelium pallidum (strain ATCC 26659 / Pp 5 / PN500) TaxID=670386 RepID=D3BUF0_HETP5|nr:hypothetical protein PPL_11769 [Heterostelium album PN500]EFA74738.1 hypothetical protein PPL_11769 [Heterostelium album PN500]|eukprot:XP_020426872.1 hypothetical protein PPL_11769 [Heterostelium album PN500]